MNIVNTNQNTKILLCSGNGLGASNRSVQPLFDLSSLVMPLGTILGRLHALRGSLSAHDFDLSNREDGYCNV